MAGGFLCLLLSMPLCMNMVGVSVNVGVGFGVSVGIVGSIELGFVLLHVWIQCR